MQYLCLFAGSSRNRCPFVCRFYLSIYLSLYQHPPSFLASQAQICAHQYILANWFYFGFPWYAHIHTKYTLSRKSTYVQCTACVVAWDCNCSYIRTGGAREEKKPRKEKKDGRESKSPVELKRNPDDPGGGDCTTVWRFQFRLEIKQSSEAGMWESVDFCCEALWLRWEDRFPKSRHYDSVPLAAGMQPTNQPTKFKIPTPPTHTLSILKIFFFRIFIFPKEKKKIAGQGFNLVWVLRNEGRDKERRDKRARG